MLCGFWRICTAAGVHRADGAALHAELSTVCQGTLITRFMLLWLLYRGDGDEVALRVQQDTGCSFLLAASSPA